MEGRKGCFIQVSSVGEDPSSTLHVAFFISLQHAELVRTQDLCTGCLFFLEHFAPTLWLPLTRLSGLSSCVTLAEGPPLTALSPSSRSPQLSLLADVSSVPSAWQLSLPSTMERDDPHPPCCPPGERDRAQQRGARAVPGGGTCGPDLGAATPDRRPHSWWGDEVVSPSNCSHFNLAIEVENPGRVPAAPR